MTLRPQLFADPRCQYLGHDQTITYRLRIIRSVKIRRMTVGCSTASCGFIPNSTIFKNACNIAWGWLSPPGVFQAIDRLAILQRQRGLIVCRGRLPGASTFDILLIQAEILQPIVEHVSAPSTTTPLPKVPLTLCVTDTRLPKRSAMENEDVSPEYRMARRPAARAVG